MQPDHFFDSTKAEPTRNADSYQLQGGPGTHACMGVDYGARSALEILKVIFSLNNLRRTGGTPGTMAGATYGT